MCVKFLQRQKCAKELDDEGRKDSPKGGRGARERKKEQEREKETKKEKTEKQRMKKRKRKKQEKKLGYT